MGLMPTIVRELFHIHNGLTIGATVSVEPGSAAVVGLLLGRVSPRGTARLGGAAMIVGAVLVTIGVSTTTLSPVVVGGVIGGVGFGASYSGSLRTITPLAKPDQRAGLFAALFTVAYLAFGVPVIIAGQLIPRLGLLSTVFGYCVVTVVVAAAGLIAQLIVRGRGSARASERLSEEADAFVPGWPGCLPPSPTPETGSVANGKDLLRGTACQSTSREVPRPRPLLSDSIRVRMKGGFRLLLRLPVIAASRVREPAGHDEHARLVLNLGDSSVAFVRVDRSSYGSSKHRGPEAASER
jgi:hypothetical protein